MTSTLKGIIILDRDGVINEMVIDPEFGTIDSPLHPSQVKIFPGVPTALKAIEAMGYALFIASNQPAAAKGKTTRKNLEAAHAEILAQSQSAGATIRKSFICWHRAEDACECRKPRVALLQSALEQVPGIPLQTSWMVGDGIVDIAAGQTLGLRTAFIGPKKCDQCAILSRQQLHPTAHIASLEEFSEFLKTFALRTNDATRKSTTAWN